MSNIPEERTDADPGGDMPLVQAARNGDLDAFESLVIKYQKRIFNIALRIAGNAEDAAEVAQDAFVSAHRALGTFRGQAKFSTWLTAIVINHARNRRKRNRSRARHEELTLDAPVRTEDGEFMPDPPSDAPSALERIEKKEQRTAVQDCIGKLEPDYRETLVLRDLQGFSYEEIGSMLKVREGTVKSRLFRAREAVKNCLQKALEDISH